MESCGQPLKRGRTEHEVTTQRLHASGHARSAMCDVVAFRAYLATLRQLVSAARAAGNSGDDIVGTVMPALSGKYSE